MAKERINISMERGSDNAFNVVKKQHMTLGTFAPDMVKWTRKDIKKLLADKKEGGE